MEMFFSYPNRRLVECYGLKKMRRSGPPFFSPPSKIDAEEGRRVATSNLRRWAEEKGARAVAEL